jgi:hypothetical protein
VAGLLVQFDEARQEPGQRLAGAGRRDQQCGAPGPRLRQQVELMRARRPAALREPARKDLRQFGRRRTVEGEHGF